MTGKPKVQVGPDFIRIVRISGSIHHELARWHESEWKADPNLVYKIVEAVTVAAFEPDLLEATLENMGRRSP